MSRADVRRPHPGWSTRWLPARTWETPREPVDGVTFVSDVREAVELASEAAGDRVVSALGAHTARSCREAGLLDEVLMIVAPVLRGDGTPLLRVPGGREVPLEPVRATPSGRVTDLWFRVPDAAR